MLPASPDLPCLFPVDFHPIPLSDLEQVCVDLFPLSKTRKAIMDGLREFVKRLEDAKVPGDVWVDGGFLTEKIDPKDVDVVVVIDGDAIYDHGTPAQRDGTIPLRQVSRI